MAESLVIVESPAKAKTIGKFLGSHYRVVASNGHVRDLPKSQLSVDVNNHFEPKYITIRGRGEAKPIFCVADVLQEFEQMDDYDAFQSGPKRIALDTLSPDERAVCSALRTESRSFDDLAEMLSLPVGQLNSLLTGMQFSGIIKPLSGRLYALDTLNIVLVDNSSANEGLEDDLHG